MDAVHCEEGRMSWGDGGGGRGDENSSQGGEKSQV